VSDMSHEESEAQSLARGSALALGAIREMAVLARCLREVFSESQIRSLVNCLSGQQGTQEEKSQ